MKNFTRREVTKSAAAGGLTLAAGLRPAKAQPAKIITFGGSIPFSGMQANTGLNVYEGYRVVIKYVNEKLGGVRIGGDTYKFELKMIDDASDPQRAVTLIQKQIDDGSTFFLGSFSSAILLPTVAVIERARRVMMHCGGASDQIFTQNYKYSFGMFPRASTQLFSFVEVLKSLGSQVKSVSIVAANDPYGITMSSGGVEALKQANIPLLNTFRLPRTVTDISGVLSSLRESTPDALIVITPEEVSQLVIQQMVATDTNIKMIYMPLGPEIEQFRKNLGKNSEELLFINFWDPRSKYQDPIFGNTQTYYEWYRANSTRDWSSQTIAGSACIVSFIKAMQDAGSLDPDKVRDAAAALNFSSLYGPVKFTAQGDGDPIAMGPKTGQVLKAQQEVVFPPDAATAKLVFPMTPWSKRM